MMHHQQHTHEKVPLSADAILNDYLSQQHKMTLKRNLSSAQTNFKQVPSGLPFSFNSSTGLVSNDHQLNQSSKKPNHHHRDQMSQNLLFSLTGDNQQINSATTRAGNEASAHLNESQQTTTTTTTNSAIVHIQRKLLAFFYIYATIIISLYLTYAIYCYHQQSLIKRQQQQLFESAATTTTTTTTTPVAGEITPASSSLIGGGGGGSSVLVNELDLSQQEHGQTIETLQLKMDNKMLLLERYIEMLALDLEETKQRLREREKCACSIGCSFNGTRYVDGQKWYSQESKCDVCHCQAGKISCAPRECPRLTCEDALQLPGQCCPSCMKKCKINKTLVRHGHTFKPNANGPEATKQCKCYDGLIKCEPIGSATNKTQVKPFSVGRVQGQGHANNKTLEYLKSILGSSAN